MINKGLDTTFIHFGIRKDDMEIIKTLSEEQGLGFEWLQENILQLSPNPILICIS